MARPPRTRQSIRRRWLEYVFGEPRRTLRFLLWAGVALLIIFVYTNQAKAIEILGILLGAIIGAAEPFLGPLAGLVAAAIGFVILWRVSPFYKGGK